MENTQDKHLHISSSQHTLREVKFALLKEYLHARQ